jgi:hypothetical protein
MIARPTANGKISLDLPNGVNSARITYKRMKKREKEDVLEQERCIICWSSTVSPITAPSSKDTKREHKRSHTGRMSLIPVLGGPHLVYGNTWYR